MKFFGREVYPIAFSLGIGLLILGSLDLIILVIALQFFSLFIVVPLIFIFGGIFLLHLAFQEVELDTFGIKDITKREYENLEAMLNVAGKDISSISLKIYQLKIKIS